MYFKMAYKNVRKSLKDYLIYFLTLTFTVCIFYSFNAMGSQQVMQELNGVKKESVQALSMMLSIVSVFVSCILGGLIIYANNFLVKKRKKELGIYMTLGMGKNKISKILFLETFLIGLMALGSGLILGLVLSQGLSLLTARLFEVTMTQYQFVLSISAIFKSILYFGIIFCVVMLFNTWSISRYELIELLTASQKNEELKIKSPVVTILLFILSLILIGNAYVIGIKVGLDSRSPVFLGVLLLGVLGTFLFFYSLLGFVLVLLMKRSKFYLRGLNPFIIKQMYYKVNTHFASMSVICLMLLLTIGMLSTGLGFKNVIENSLVGGTPFDATATEYFYSETVANEEPHFIKAIMEKIDFKFQEGEQVVYYKEYVVAKELKKILQPYSVPREKATVERQYSGTVLSAVKLSDYNALRMLQGRLPMSLDSDKVLVLSNREDFEGTVQQLIDQRATFDISGKQYGIQNKEVLKEQFVNEGFKSNIMSLVVPDDAITNQEVCSMQMSVSYGASQGAEERFSVLFDALLRGEIPQSEDHFILGYTKEALYNSQMGLTNSILFVGIYMGIIFLLASAAMLALQQLAEAGESKERYKVLAKIGTSKKIMYQAVFIQVLAYFILPLSLAIVHALVGIHIINDFLVSFGRPNILRNALMTMAILLLIYGGYFLATYSGYKSTIKGSK